MHLIHLPPDAHRCKYLLRNKHKSECDDGGQTCRPTMTVFEQPLAHPLQRRPVVHTADAVAERCASPNPCHR